MTVLIDTNLLVYATFSGMDQHAKARPWLSERFDDRDSFVGLSWPALYGFVRIVANRRIMGNTALPVADAWSAADAYRRQPTARMVEPGDVHAAIAGRLFATPGLTANDVPDVHVAALALEHGLTLCTHDRGFARFEGLRLFDPVV